MGAIYSAAHVVLRRARWEAGQSVHGEMSMNRRSFIAGAASLAAALTTSGALSADDFVTHPDGKVFVRLNDKWLPA